MYMYKYTVYCTVYTVDIIIFKMICRNLMGIQFVALLLGGKLEDCQLGHFQNQVFTSLGNMSLTQLINSRLLHCLKSYVVFTHKRSQAKGVYYVFLYKQHLDNVYTRVASTRFTIGSLAVSQFSSSPLQLQISTMAPEYRPNLPPGLTDAEPISSSDECLQPDSLSLSSSGLVELQFLRLSRRSLQGSTHPIRA